MRKRSGKWMWALGGGGGVGRGVEGERVDVPCWHTVIYRR